MVLCKYKEFMRGKKTGFYIIFTRIFCTCKILDLYTCKKHYRVQNANILMLVFKPVVVIGFKNKNRKTLSLPQGLRHATIIERKININFGTSLMTTSHWQHTFHY